MRSTAAIRSSRNLVQATALLVLACLSQLAHSSSQLGVDLCASTDKAFIGTVQSVHSYYAPVDSTQSIKTDAVISVSHVIHGSVEPAETLTYEGGVVGTQGLSSSGSPTMKEGQRWLLFIDNHPLFSDPVMLKYQLIKKNQTVPPEVVLQRLWPVQCGT
jgi:hypothetical protein